MRATSEGTSEAPANPARAWAASMTSALGLITMSTMAIRKRTTATWKKIFEPKRWPSLAPSMTKPDTPSEYITMAVPTVVGGVLKLLTMPPIETGSAATLKDISICPMAMTIIGSHDACTSVSALATESATRVLTASRLRARGEQVHPELLRQERGHELALNAVPGAIQRRGEGAQSSLARRHGDDPAADAALAR